MFLKDPTSRQFHMESARLKLWPSILQQHYSVREQCGIEDGGVTWSPFNRAT